MKKILTILLVFILVLSLAACGSKTPPRSDTPSNGSSVSNGDKTEETGEPKKIKAAMMQESTFGGGGFADFALLGAETACKEYNIDFTVMENVAISTIENTIYTMVEQGYNLFLFPGAGARDVFLELAPQMPDVYFALFDVKAEGYDNLMSVAYREQEACYLVGALAALESKTGSIGFIGGVEGETIIRWESGYVAGARTINPDIDIKIVYTGSFSDLAAGKETALMMYNQGVDFIQAAAGAGNVGLYQLMEESKYTDKWCFGGGVDGQFSQAPNSIVAAPIKLVNNSTYRAVESLVKGEWEGNVAISSGIAEGGVDILYNEECLLNVSDEHEAIIDAMRNDILSGDLVVPSTREELAAFEYPSYK